MVEGERKKWKTSESDEERYSISAHCLKEADEILHS
jgi:hypothetical protein